MRNILLFIDSAEEAEGLVKNALKIANQCKANLQLCNVAPSQVKEKLSVNHYYSNILLHEPEGIDIEEFARQLKVADQINGGFVPVVHCLELSSFTPRTIREMVIRNNVWLIIIDERQLNQLKNIDSGNFASRVIENINCPVLLVPQHFEMSYFHKIAYVTDLRYCDLGVVQFLKVFNAQLFVTHISAPGLPDMEERYAQEILAEEVSVKANYLKMFLRNLKNKNIKESVDKVLDTLEIKMLALVSKKHQTFERLFDRFPEKTQIYHNLPTLIFPYLNWFNQVSFYTQ
jgi:nucleotide-binding universal stress UspA family protein